MGREQVLRHLTRSKRHVVLQPPGQETDGGSRHKLCVHSKRHGEMLIGRGQFASVSRCHLCNIVLDEFLKPANSLTAQHQLVKLLVLCRVLEESNTEEMRPPRFSAFPGAGFVVAQKS